MQSLYAYYKHAGDAKINEIEKELLFSINKSYDLYHHLLALIIDICNYAEQRIEIAQQKKLPSSDDLNPNTRFIYNKLVQQLRINNDLLRYLEVKKLSWVNYPELIKGIYQAIHSSQEYKNYMGTDQSGSFDVDKGFIAKLYKNIISNHEPLYSALEEQSIYWNDEIEFVFSAVIKTIKGFDANYDAEQELMPLFKSKEDEEFSKKLFRKVILNKKDYSKLIEQFSKNWEYERIAFMDILIIQIAIAEAIEFSSIPIKVTFNEYIELSKFYSTKRSNVFINGMLDKIFNHLKKEKIILKQGRGLIGEV